MTLEIGVLLSILLLLIVLFALDRYPPEIVALGAMLLLVASGIITPAHGFSGFGSDTVVMIAGLLVMSAALFKTGVVDITARFILDRIGDRPKLLLPMIVISVAPVSSLISNTAATAFFVPVVLGLTAKLKVSASKYLLPLAFASILVSSVTLISTSTNIITSELLTRYGQPAMGMFELTPVGVVIAVVGIVYLLTIGARLIPDRSNANPGSVNFGLSQYLTDIIILPDSPLIGKTLAESDVVKNLELTVLRIVRAGKYVSPYASTKIAAGDILLVEAARENVLKIQDIKGIELKGDVKLIDPEINPANLMLIEAVVLPPSPLIGRTLKFMQFRDRYDIQVLAINRHGPAASTKLSETPLRAGDVLLLQGNSRDIQVLSDLGILRPIGNVDKPDYQLQHAPIAIAIFVTALLCASMNLISFPLATLCGAFFMLITKCITPEDVYRRLEWPVLILIGCMLSVGIAMDQTGAGKYLATGLLAATSNMTVILCVFFVLAVLLTQAMSNQAAAIVLVPIAAQTAMQMNCDMRPLIMMIAIAASCSYLTPLEPSCLMVYGPGNYRFRDFFIVGWPLTIIIFVIAIIMVPIIWPV